MPPTRQQTEFEKCLIEALRSANVASAISEAIINNISKKLAEKFNYYDTKISALEAEIQLLKSENRSNQNDSLVDNKQNLIHKIDNLEQRAKNNNIRLMGIKKDDKENTVVKVKQLVEEKLRLKLNDGDIISAYRVNKKNTDRPNHIILTLKDNQTKSKIYGLKKMLKGCGVVMKEDLTVERLKIVKEASDKYGFKNVWTYNGTIYIKTEAGVEKIFI